MSEILLKIYFDGAIQVTVPYKSDSGNFTKSEISQFATQSLLEAMEDKGMDANILNSTLISLSYYHERFGFVNITENSRPTDGAHVDIYFDTPRRKVTIMPMQYSYIFLTLVSQQVIYGLQGFNRQISACIMI